MPHTSNLFHLTLTVSSLSTILIFSLITLLPLHVRTFHQYVDWVNTDDPEAEWKGEEACNIYAHKNGVDLFKGTY